jgi:hypothetical protein
VRPEMTKFKIFKEKFLFCGNYILKYCLHQLVIRNTIFRKPPPSVVSGYGKRSINLNKVVANFEKHIFLSQTDLTLLFAG